MGNCCAVSTDPLEKKRRKKEKKPNPFSIAYNRGLSQGDKLVVLRDPTGRDIESRYELGQELGRGEFGITYHCTDNETGEVFARKSISKKKLRTTIDIEDVRREVEVMRHLSRHPNMVSLKDTYETVLLLLLLLLGFGLAQLGSIRACNRAWIRAGPIGLGPGSGLISVKYFSPSPA